MQDVKNYNFIDALRGYAIALVVLSHAGQQVASHSPWLRELMSASAHGVQLFYVASAMTLCLSWQQRSQEEHAPIRNFFIRRFFRIAPMFYLAMLGYLLLYGFAPRYWAPDGLNWGTVILTALFVNGFHPATITSVVPGGWSIAVEMNFYLVLPFLMTWLTSTRRLVLFFFISLLVSLTSRFAFEALYLAQFPPNQHYLVADFLGLNIFAQLPVFACGMLSYRLFVGLPRSKFVLMLSNIGFAMLSAGLAVALPEIFPRLLVHPIYVGAACGLIALNLGWWGHSALASKPIRLLGKISYSTYLIHVAVIEALAACGANSMLGKSTADLSLLYFALVLGVSALLAYATYRLVERPGIQWGKRLIQAWEAKQPARRAYSSV